LNAVGVPDGADEAAVRRKLLSGFNIEIGAGLGPLKGKIWRVGLMGETSRRENVAAFLAALKTLL
jgi:alanine-glyoxylate transaminase/serine-glyoxylate transaminase/serine-pyruvate transaminase